MKFNMLEDLFMDYLPIKSFSKISGIESSTLRYWDDYGIFPPLGRHPDTNYRYYSISQLLSLNFITTLSVLEIPLKTIAELKEGRNPDSFLELLEKVEKQMDIEMNDLHQKYSIIHAIRELINLGIKADEQLIYVSPKDEKPIIIWPKNEYSDDCDSFIEPLAAKVAIASDYHINLSFPVGGIYESLDTFAKSPRKPCHFFSIDPHGHDKINAGDYLIGFCRGDYGEVGDLPIRLKTYAEENSLQLSGPVYIEYLFDELCTLNPGEYLAQCFIAVSSHT